MDKTEIDKALALAIGHAPGDIGLTSDGVHVWHSGKSRIFDHTDPAVIWPVAERFDAFPIKLPSGQYVVFQGSIECAATATALAVIEHCKKGQP